MQFCSGQTRSHISIANGREHRTAEWQTADMISGQMGANLVRPLSHIASISYLMRPAKAYELLTILIPRA